MSPSATDPSATDPSAIQVRPPVKEPLNMTDLITVLIKHHGLHEGTFDLLVEFQIGVGAFGPTPDQLYPGASVAIARVGLMQALKPGPLTVDASVVNPASA